MLDRKSRLRLEKGIFDRAMLVGILLGTGAFLWLVAYVSSVLGASAVRVAVFLMLAATIGLVWFTWMRFKRSGLKAPTLSEVRAMRQALEADDVDSREAGPEEPIETEGVQAPVSHAVDQGKGVLRIDENRKGDP